MDEGQRPVNPKMPSDVVGVLFRTSTRAWSRWYMSLDFRSYEEIYTHVEVHLYVLLCAGHQRERGGGGHRAGGTPRGPHVQQSGQCACPHRQPTGLETMRHVSDDMPSPYCILSVPCILPRRRVVCRSSDVCLSGVVAVYASLHLMRGNRNSRPSLECSVQTGPWTGACLIVRITR